MKTSITTLTLTLAIVGAATPALARDELARELRQSLQLADGSTLHLFKDGKMAKEDRYGRAAYLKKGELLELADGRKMTADSNEVARLHYLLYLGHRP